MFTNTQEQNRQGLSLIGVMTGVALMVILFLGVFGMFRSSLAILFDSTARAGATALMEERMEYIRSLPYRDVGTKGGIPDGVLEEQETLQFNGMTYDRRVFVQYYDDPADGTGSSDENNVTQDYKRAKVAVSWQGKRQEKTIESASFIMPDGVETSEGGGTLSIRVFDAVGDPVENAEIHIKNSSTSPEVDTTTFTDPDGRIRFSGAPAAGGYQVEVGKSGFSQAQTYDRTATNVSPDPGHLTVASSSVTTASFPIDLLSSLNLKTVTPITQATDTVAFSDATKIASSSNVSVDNGSLQLAGSGGGYATSGVAYTTEVGTSSVYSWQQTLFRSTTSADTIARVHVAETTPSGYQRLPDSELANNSSGFTSPPIDMSSVSTTTYNRLAYELRLGTTNTSTTPRIGTTTTRYSYGRAQLADVNFDVRGDKTTGETSDGDPIYKHSFSTSTDTSGINELTELEWDTYHFEPVATSSLRTAAACPAEPLDLAPGTTTDVTLALADITGSGNTLRVVVDDEFGNSITGATTTVSSGNSSVVQTTGPCGQSFFTDLDSSTSYKLEVIADGYVKTNESGIAVDGETVQAVEMNAK